MKPEIIFGLESAAWPAMLVNASCVVLRANAAATTTFSAALVGDAPSLSLIWAPDNGVTPEEFFARWEQSPKVGSELKLRVTGGTILKFNVVVCAFTREDNKWYVLQLLPAPPTAAESPAAGTASEAGGLILKQKLDCALQLARTVSLDFNNALTIILGHTSLVLSKMEPNHPWRDSLMEVEKSASKAAEIANDLGTFSRQEKETRAQTAGNLNLLLQRTVQFFQQNAGAEPVAWTLQLDRKLFTAKFDEAKMQQAFMKIIENALQALRERGR